MRCEICGGRCAYDFSKPFNACGLTTVDYWRCDACGFVLSRTHAEMSQQEWQDLNFLCHARYQGSEGNALDPRWMTRMDAQARSLTGMAGAQLLHADQRWLDYGCGDGALSNRLAATGLKLEKYDRYMATSGDYLKDGDLRPGAFDFVISTAVFEHLSRREQWDEINALVSPTGALGVCTLVAETVPRDPSWFYLEPPHCAFFSNAAMTRLFDDWGYRASVYDVAASLWVWFRDDPAVVEDRVAHLNRTATAPLLFRRGFLDYWKVDPRARQPGG